MEDKQANKKFYDRFCPDALMKDIKPSVDFCIKIAETFIIKNDLKMAIVVSPDKFVVGIAGEYATNAEGSDLADCIKTCMMMYPEADSVNDG